MEKTGKRNSLLHLLRFGRKYDLLGRLLVLEILNHVLINKEKTSEFFLYNKKDLQDVSTEQLAYSNRVAKKVLKNLSEIDSLIASLVKKKPSIDVLNVLRLAILELNFEKTPPYACVNSAVSLAKIKLKDNYAVGFVNAVLRSLLRNDQSQKKSSRTLVYTKYSTDLANYFAKINGRGLQEEIWSSFKNDSPTDITVRDKNELGKWEKALGGKRIGRSNSIRLQKVKRVSKMLGYSDGAWWIQNFSASLPVLLMGNIKDKQVLDCCSAPGGKTMQLASLGAKTTSIDRSEKRIKTLQRNLERTMLKSKIIVSDIFDFVPQQLFDVVLLDAPCSSTGTLRKNPEIEYLNPISRIKTFSKIQIKMIEHVKDWVKPGGSLIFSTCSIFPDEGEEIISAFLKNNKKNYRVGEIKGNGLGLKKSWIDELGGIRLSPEYFSEIGGIDGFYIAVLKKNKTTYT